ncbi:GA113 protein, partial [Pheucticus melanocephalus]|nr:GA113 protein [Pheucticus melanocephalus]
MERQAAYDLFTCFLQKREVKGIDLQEELRGLLAYGCERGVFQNPHTVHELTEWRKFGDKLWEAAIDEDETARKLGKLWRVVRDELLQHQAEEKAAREADKNKGSGAWSDCPLPPAVSTIVLPPTPSGNSRPAGVSDPAGAIARIPGAQIDPAGAIAQIRIPGAQIDPAGAIARQRREAWAALTKEMLLSGDCEAVAAAVDVARLVVFSPLATITALDWKLLSQLRATAGQFGVSGEPTKQILDYIWGTQVLLPNDCRGVARLILTQHQQLLFNSHWQSLCQECVAVARQPGDPLHGITLEELMGLGPFLRTEAQALMGPDKCREAMRLARLAMDRIKEPGGIPCYMGIKQGRDEAFGSFIDKAAAAMERAGVPDYVKGALLKECALQNCNQATRKILNTLGANWSVEEALERLADVPVGNQAMLAEALKELGAGLQKQAAASQSQLLAALAALQAAATNTPRAPSAGRMKCYRCGGTGHPRRACPAAGVWCQNCRSDTHNTGACRRRWGTGRASA